MAPYSKEMRREILAACDRGEGTRAAALRFRRSESWVRRAKQERRELGKRAPLLTRRRTPKWEPYRERMLELIAAQPDLTLQELKGVREAMEAIGATLMFVPPYSPDLNPIENAFANFQWLLNSTPQRTVAAFWNACGRLLDRFAKYECRNYIRHCGCRFT